MKSYAPQIHCLDAEISTADLCKIATKLDSANSPKSLVMLGFEADLESRALVRNTTPITSFHNTPSNAAQTPLRSTPSNPFIRSPIPFTIESLPPDVRALLPKPSQRNEKAKATLSNELQNPWRDLWAHQKVARSFIAAEEAGSVAFSLNFSPRLEKTLEASNDPARLLSTYIARELKQAVGATLPFSFALEISPTGRLHAHGVVVVGSDFDESRIRAVDEALCCAGGKMKTSQIAQSHLALLYDGAGWHIYTRKAFEKTCRHLGTDKVVFVSTPLKRLCK